MKLCVCESAWMSVYAPISEVVTYFFRLSPFTSLSFSSPCPSFSSAFQFSLFSPNPPLHFYTIFLVFKIDNGYFHPKELLLLLLLLLLFASFIRIPSTSSFFFLFLTTAATNFDVPLSRLLDHHHLFPTAASRRQI